jgi:hypothetical protein
MESCLVEIWWLAGQRAVEARSLLTRISPQTPSLGGIAP